MHLRYVHYFLAVAESLSFTRAAENLHISQPALSQHIKALEENLSTQLFDRSGRQIRLTDAGEVYLQYIRRAFQALNEGKRAVHDLADLSRGSIKLAVTPTFVTYFIGPMTNILYNKYPHIHLNIQSATQDKIEYMLMNDEIDIGIGFDESHSPNISTIPLLIERLALVVSSNHALANREFINLDELHQYPMVLLNQKFATRVQIDDHFRHIGVHLQAHTEVDSISAIIEIISRTPLVTIIPENIPRHNNDLVAIPLPDKQFERTAIIMRRKDAWQSVAITEFISLATELAHELEKITTV